MIGNQKDPLIGTLPAAPNNTGSPALAGQPQAITGAPPTTPVPQTQAQGSALAPASPGSGSAEIGAPLSNQAPEQQAGAGANLDLVKDRGTPEEYWGKNIQTLGTKESLKLLSDAANGSSGKTGKFAERDPEEIRRTGTRMNEAMGIVDRESQDQAVESLIYKPMTTTILDEVNKGIVSEDDGVMRMVMTMAQVEGAADDDELASLLALARKRISGDK